MRFGSGIAFGGPYIEPPPPVEPEAPRVYESAPTPAPTPREAVARAERERAEYARAGNEVFMVIGGVAALLGVITTVAFLVESKRG